MSETDEARLERIQRGYSGRHDEADWQWACDLAREALASRARVEKAVEQSDNNFRVILDMHAALGVEWGTDVYAAIKQLRDTTVLDSYVDENQRFSDENAILAAQVETLRSALEPFSYLVDTLKCSRDENSWVMKVEGREPITVGDLRRARDALQSLSATEPSR